MTLAVSTVTFGPRAGQHGRRQPKLSSERTSVHVVGSFALTPNLHSKSLSDGWARSGRDNVKADKLHASIRVIADKDTIPMKHHTFKRRDTPFALHLPPFANTAASTASTWLPQAPPTKRTCIFPRNHGSQFAPTVLVTGWFHMMFQTQTVSRAAFCTSSEAIDVSPLLHLPFVSDGKTWTTLRSAFSRLWRAFAP